MTCDLVALAIDANDPRRVAEFWAGVLGWELDDSGAVIGLLPADDTGFRLRFPRTLEPKVGANQFHFDIRSESPEQQRETVARALALGGRHHDVGQLPEEEHVVLADPEGNEFCVIEAGNNFLADSGFIGALSGDGSQATGYFWSAALDWPLVWDQDEETAIRSPHGGPKVTWGGPPLTPKTGKERVHLHLAPPADGDQQLEADRLVALGARRADIGQGSVDWVVLADPDGHEFCLLPAGDAG
ncbi:MAG TPA: VOC family protein [Ornithinibacter sp.]|nr:VOC family protein [Ornithinibacter sp.]